MEMDKGNINQDTERIVEVAKAAAADPKVEAFYVGRTNSPKRRRREHGAKRMLLLYGTQSAGEANEVAEAVRAELSDHRKQHPTSREFAEPPTGEGSEQYVYLALWGRSLQEGVFRVFLRPS